MHFSNTEAWEMEIHHLPLWTITMLRRGADDFFQRDFTDYCSPLSSYRSARSSMDSTQPLWCSSVTLDFMKPLCVHAPSKSIMSGQRGRLRCICRNQIWVTIQTTSKCCLDLIWKNLISYVPVFQKADFGWQSEHCVHVKTGIVLFVHWSNVVLHMWAYIHDNYIASKEPKACAVTAFSLGRNRMGSNCSSIKHNSYSQYWVTAVIVGFNCNPGSVKYSKNRNHSVSILDWHFMIQ